MRKNINIKKLLLVVILVMTTFYTFACGKGISYDSEEFTSENSQIDQSSSENSEEISERNSEQNSSENSEQNSEESNVCEGIYEIYSCSKTNKQSGESITYLSTDANTVYSTENYSFYLKADGTGSCNFGSIVDKTVNWQIAGNELTVTVYEDSLDKGVYVQSVKTLAGIISEDSFVLNNDSATDEIVYSFIKSDTKKPSDYLEENYFVGEYSSLNCQNPTVYFEAVLYSNHSASFKIYNSSKQLLNEYSNCVYVISVHTVQNESKYQISIYYGQQDGLPFCFYFTESDGFIDVIKND